MSDNQGDKMRIFKITFLILLFWIICTGLAICIANKVHAEEVTFTWTPNTDDVTLGYNLYQNSGSNKIKTIEGKDANTITLNATMAEGCNTFYLTAYSKNAESVPSAIATWCPPRVEVPIVQGFTGQ